MNDKWFMIINDQPLNRCPIPVVQGAFSIILGDLFSGPPCLKWLLEFLKVLIPWRLDWVAVLDHLDGLSIDGRVKNELGSVHRDLKDHLKWIENWESLQCEQVLYKNFRMLDARLTILISNDILWLHLVFITIFVEIFPREY